jgi:serine/threonine protein kinase
MVSPANPIATPCPDNDTFQLIMAGNASEVVSAHFERHIGSCLHCQQRFDTAVGTFVFPEPKNPSSEMPEVARKKQSAFNSLLGECWEADFGSLPISPEPDMLGRLGSYDLVRTLGVGGMGIVFEACHVSTKCRVAIKTLRHFRIANRATRLRFLQEARAMQSINHPSVVSLLEISETEGIPWFAMPLLHGSNAADFMRLHVPLSFGICIDLIRQAAVALQTAHAQGIYHRDIKPSNLWIDDTDPRHLKLLLLDFGLAWQADSDALSTQSGMILGTLAYLPPEQLEAPQREPDAAGDLYSLGCVFYEMLTGTPLVNGASPFKQMHQINTLKHPPLCQLRRDIPPRLERLVLQLLDRNPARRTPNAATLLRQLDAPNLLKIPLISRRQALWGGITLATAATAATGTWLLARPKNAPTVPSDISIEVADAVALTTCRSWKDGSQADALVWSNSSGTLFRQEINGGPRETWGQVGFPVTQLYMCHDKAIAACGTNGQLQFLPWYLPNWKPGISFITKSKSIHQGFSLQIMKDRFFAVENDTITTYSYMTGGIFSSGPRFGSPIIHACEQPATYNALLALKSGELIGLDLPKQVLMLKPLHTWLQIGVTSGPFQLACHNDGNTVACLDLLGKLTFHHLNDPNTIHSSHQIDFIKGSSELVNLFHPGTSRKLVVHQITDETSSAILINPDPDFSWIKFDARAPLLVGQINGNIWILDSDAKWKHYSIS